MPEFRTDPLTGRPVIFAEGRALRPNDFRERGPCPFCPGHEQETPPEVLAYREGGAPDSPGWRVRVVPNRYPAVGAHEVIIESPDHAATFASMTLDHLVEVLSAWRDRILSLGASPYVQYVQVFKNHGPEAGASLEHPHSQLTGLPMVPPQVEQELRCSLRHFDECGACWYCDQAREAGNRAIATTETHIAFAPPVPRFPCEIWIQPLRHESHFEHTNEPRGLAAILGETLARIDQALQSPAYNLLLHTAPVHEGAIEHYHWHIEIMPKLGKIGGFEWGTGIHINEISPESAAARLRLAAATSRKEDKQ